jgi:streptogramin lyase
VLQRISVRGGVCGGIAADPARIWVSSAQCGSHPSISAIDRQTGRVVEFPIAATPLDVAAAFGSLWVTTESPARLLRIDPATGTVVGILGLPAPAGPAALAVASDALWVRAAGSLLRVVPQD